MALVMRTYRRHMDCRNPMIHAQDAMPIVSRSGTALRRTVVALISVIGLAVAGSAITNAPMLQKGKFASTVKHLGLLRSTFGEPKVEINPETTYPKFAIWVAEPQNYDNTQLFPMGRSNERLYLNQLDPGDEAYLALESKTGEHIRKEWFATLEPAKERDSISPKELRLLGTIEAYLARKGYRIKAFKD